ncbi:hypothetical protein [Clostridium frigidicarnis]|uniref:Uncharacterized protein n=1 Tax=Clostridium frigidicarnis TaxID=84698 RepID=A0A1I1AQJ9_9CLOT|nr:hypothetical protein [Clostridium frigidicarnis]SFB38613.1 hypothetical protein SAMN04488528_103922 [Clostridium frigidicarnis]
MEIFQLKTQPEGIERVSSFVNENFICIGYSELDDLTNKNKDEIREEIREKYKYEGSRLGNHLGNVNAFVNTMKEEDIVLITENDWVHIGRVGGYEYDCINNEWGMYHRRYVKWIGKAPKHELNEYVRELLRNRSILTKFKHPTDIAELDKVLTNGDISSNRNSIDYNIVEKALNILVSALDSDNEEIRVKAAIGLLQHNKFN